MRESHFKAKCVQTSPRRYLQCRRASPTTTMQEALIEIDGYYQLFIASPFRPTLILTVSPSGDEYPIPTPHPSVSERAACVFARYHSWVAAHRRRALEPGPEFHGPLDIEDQVLLFIFHATLLYDLMYRRQHRHAAFPSSEQLWLVAQLTSVLEEEIARIHLPPSTWNWPLRAETRHQSVPHRAPAVLVPVERAALPADKRDCAISQDDYADDHAPISLPCLAGHVIAKSYIEEWLKVGSGHRTCPLCRGRRRPRPGGL